MNLQYRLISYTSLIAAMILWSSSFPALKIAFRAYDPMVVIFGRMAVASLCFLMFFRYFKSVRLEKGTLKQLAFMAFCEPCLYFVFEAKALEHTTASQAGIIAGTLPLMVAVAAHYILKERMSRQNLFGLTLAIAGACWLSMTGQASESAPDPPLGNFLEFVAMIFATGYIITLKKLSRFYSPLFLTATQAVVGCFFYMPLLLLPSTTLPTAFDATGLFAIAYLGAFVTIGAYGLYNFSLSRVPVNQATVFVNLIPVFTIFLGWLILNEQLLPQQYLATMLILTGIFVSQGGMAPDDAAVPAAVEPCSSPK
ncbi:DMT family transporter [Desulfococcus sp.]|uniref:DMT family transporter n=1 Tax=Desulfococcus sp. TaxID=2025834 RepID=UPI00359427A1